MYTWFGYDGVGACSRMKDELRRELEREGKTWAEVVKGSVESLSEKVDVRAGGKDGLAGNVKAAVRKVETKGKENVNTLIQNAEEIGRQLDKLAKRIILVNTDTS